LVKSFKELISDEPNPPPVKESWGFHLLIDMSGCEGPMDSPPEVKRFFEDIIKKLKMKPLTPIKVVTVDDKEEGRGLSAIQMITTSHIAMHTDDEYACAFMDIFSCKLMEPNDVLPLIREFFKPKRLSFKFIYRDAGQTNKHHP
jgi:S-adenosylmethionine/arginine decarboxylase-like enzyme